LKVAFIGSRTVPDPNPIRQIEITRINAGIFMIKNISRS